MTGKDIRKASEIISDVTEKGTYLHIALKNVSQKAVHLLVYGTMEKYFALNYIMVQLCDKIKNNLRPYMMVSLYCTLYTDTPLGVVTNAVCEGLESAGKGAVKGFFTAVLKSADRAEYSLPAPGKKGYDEVTFNMPSWLVGMYKKDYPDRYKEIIEKSEKHRTHVVPYCEEWEINSADPNAEKTDTGFFVHNGKEIGELFAEGKITYMSPGSVLICESAGDVKGKEILDCCAAPGGKSVYLAKKGGIVTACDIHEHRLKLIGSYAKRMRADVRLLLRDATVFSPDFAERFDVVLCDVPCSGFGVIDKKRDIVINRKYEDVIALTDTQKRILANCSAYVKPGGTLVYSTCTVFKKENEDIVDDFLSSNDEFSLDCKRQYLPDGVGMEGFFVCRMKRN